MRRATRRARSICAAHARTWGPFSSSSARCFRRAPTSCPTRIVWISPSCRTKWLRCPPVLCRRAGAIVPLEDRSPRRIDFGSGEEPCVPVSWGDVATAFHSTGVGNITVYFRRTKLFRSANIAGKLFGPILRSGIGQKGLAAIVRSFLKDPAAQKELPTGPRFGRKRLTRRESLPGHVSPRRMPTTSRRIARWRSLPESARCRLPWAQSRRPRHSVGILC